MGAAVEGKRKGGASKSPNSNTACVRLTVREVREDPLRRACRAFLMAPSRGGQNGPHETRSIGMRVGGCAVMLDKRGRKKRDDGKLGDQLNRTALIRYP